jgi:hypothetical protein
MVVAFAPSSIPLQYGLRRTSLFSFIKSEHAIQLTFKDGIRLGLQASQNAQRNITAAEEACDTWKEIFALEDDFFAGIPPDVIKLSKSLYASCLVRTGQDAVAIPIYNDLLEQYTTKAADDEISEWRLAKARCHQRLMEYSAALCEYQTVFSLTPSPPHALLEQALTGAVTCAMRLGDVSFAGYILSSVTQPKSTAENTDGSPPSSSIMLLTALIQYLRSGNAEQASADLNSHLRAAEEESAGTTATSSSSLFFRWILCMLIHTDGNQSQNVPGEIDIVLGTSTMSRRERFMELIRINASPFDDPNLRYLDDKIELHKMLTTNTVGEYHKSVSSFWPEGAILPEGLADLKQKANPDSSMWISKSRAGYGSHGNQIMTLTDACNKRLEATKLEFGQEEEKVLLQRMVDPLLLLNGYKFSLRIYVVYFSPSEMYISTKGLVKLASRPLLPSKSPADSRMHMTNSGREASMQQYDLDYLWEALSDNAAGQVWTDICKITSILLTKSFPQCVAMNHTSIETAELQGRRENFGVPKILGLDFVVEDASDARTYNPWLVEVNRFPGLEPRDEVDRNVKYQVVRDAWAKAADRVDSERCNRVVHDFVEPILNGNKESSLHMLRTDNY